MMIRSLTKKKVLSSNQIVGLLKKYRHGRAGPEYMKPYEKERYQFKLDMKETRAKITKEYWDEQTRIENNWLDEHNMRLKEMKYRNDARERNSIIRNSFVCYEMMKKEIDRQQEFRAKQKIWQKEDMELLMKKHGLLTLLDEQSKSWITYDNLDEKVDENINILVPPSIITHKDYYLKLQKQAILYDQGKYEEAENVRTSKHIINYKNKFLVAIFRDLKNLIRKVTFTEEHVIFEQYKDYVNRVRNIYVFNPNNPGFGKS